ncbi:MAG: hypothetical protein ACK42L_07980, partial [Thermoanaerobaculum sp.]
QTFQVVDQVVFQPNGGIQITYKEVNRDVAMRVVSFSGSGQNDSLTVSVPEADSSLLDQNAKVAIVLNNVVKIGNITYGGSTEVLNAFEYLADYRSSGAAQIFEIIPDKGSWQGGEEVTITGQNLCVFFLSSTGLCDTTVPPAVRFDPPNLQAQVTHVSPDGRMLRVITPKLAPQAPNRRPTVECYR